MRRLVPTLLVVLTACASAGSAASPSVPVTVAPTTATTSPAPTSTEVATTAAPEAGELLVLGDFGSGSSEEKAVAAAMEAEAAANPVAAVVTTGDNLYVDDDGPWTGPFAWVDRAGIEVWPAWGNHDIETERRIEVENRLWGAPRRYTRSWDGVTVLFLDANTPDDPDQLAYLDRQLADAPGPVIAVFHQPAVSCSKHGSTPGVDDLWMPRFAEAGVALVLNGHDHNYQHHRVDGVDYVVTGGGGRSLYAIEPCADGSQPLFAASLYHFLTVRRSDAGLVVTAIDGAGRLVDRFEVPLG